jgi:hypothetical protein
LTNLNGKADGLIGLGQNLASLGDPCATPKLFLISVSISFEKFPDKTMLSGVGDVDGLLSRSWPPGHPNDDQSLLLSSFA